MGGGAFGSGGRTGGLMNKPIAIEVFEDDGEEGNESGVQGTAGRSSTGTAAHVPAAAASARAGGQNSEPEAMVVVGAERVAAAVVDGRNDAENGGVQPARKKLRR